MNKRDLLVLRGDRAPRVGADALLDACVVLEQRGLGMTADPIMSSMADGNAGLARAVSDARRFVSQCRPGMIAAYPELCALWDIEPARVMLTHLGHGDRIHVGDIPVSGSAKVMEALEGGRPRKDVLAKAGLWESVRAIETKDDHSVYEGERHYFLEDL